jgi:hypothetical protein
MSTLHAPGRIRAVCALLVGGLLLAVPVLTVAQAPATPVYPGEPPALLLWPAGAPGAVGDSTADRPTITPWLPAAGRANGTAVVTVQLLYSDHVTVDGITIADNGGPSTDGVDIDSSRWILVQNTDIHNNDDTIVLKSGRDADGLRVARPTEYVVVRNNLMRKGAGVVSFGSETSGSIRHVVALDNRSTGTTAGIIFKSARTRGGIVEDVLVRGLTLENVPTAFSFTLDWNPSYSYATLPADTAGMPAHWRTLTTPVVPAARGLAEFRNITIEDVRVTGARRIFAAAGLPEKPIHDVRWRNVTAEGAEAGSIAWARDWTMENVTVRTPGGAGVTITHSVAVDAPRAVRP